LLSPVSYQGLVALLAHPQWKMGEHGKWVVPELSTTQSSASSSSSSSSSAKKGSIARDSACVLAERKFLLTTSKAISQGWDGAYINELDLFSVSETKKIGLDFKLKNENLCLSLCRFS